MPEPLIEEEQGGISITFLKDIYTEDFLQKQDLEKRQITVLLYIKEFGAVSNSQYQKLTGVSKRTATRDLQELLLKGFIQKEGITGRGTVYGFPKGKGAKKGPKGS